jgi:predicted Zn-ribbon and HTH transcriptional regulator
MSQEYFCRDCELVFDDPIIVEHDIIRCPRCKSDNVERRIQPPED